MTDSATIQELLLLRDLLSDEQAIAVKVAEDTQHALSEAKYGGLVYAPYWTGTRSNASYRIATHRAKAEAFAEAVRLVNVRVKSLESQDELDALLNELL